MNAVILTVVLPFVSNTRGLYPWVPGVSDMH